MVFQTVQGQGPDPKNIVRMRRDREYLNPRDIGRLGLDQWFLAIITGINTHGDESMRVFFRPDEGSWKSAVQRCKADWEQLFSMLNICDLKELNGLKVWLKLYEHAGKTDIAEIAPYERAR